MSHKSFHLSTDTGAGMERATDFHRTELANAVVGMAGEISRPEPVKYYLDDLARGRTKLSPLGRYPEIAEECAKAGASFVSVIKPLQVMLAHLRRRYGIRAGNLRDAIARAEREEAEAECVEVRLAFSVGNPERSVLASFIKEKREMLLAEEEAVLIAEDMLYAEEAR